MLTVGLDVHFGKSQMCVLDGNGKRIREREIKGPWTAVVEELGKLPEEFQVGYEASTGYGVLYENIRKLPKAKRVVVGHPGQMRLIYRAKRKNDRIDGRKIATLLYLDQVPVVHVPGQDVRSWRGLIEWRQKLLGRRVMVKNQLRGLLKGCGIVPRPGQKLWSQEGLAWLGQQALPTEFEALRREMLLEELADQNAKLRRLEGALDQLAARHPGVALLRTIPGVGPRTAEAFVAYVDDPGRFARRGQVGSYFGLVPCQDASADTNRLGHITKEGPATVRKLLTEAAWQGVRRCPRMRRRFERILGGKAERRKIALVALTRWLAEVMLALLQSGEVWREEAPAPETPAAAVSGPAIKQPDSSTIGTDSSTLERKLESPASGAARR